MLREGFSRLTGMERIRLKPRLRYRLTNQLPGVQSSGSWGESSIDLSAKPSMSQSEEPRPPGRHKTPRVPSTVFYDRVVPIALSIMALVLIVVVMVAVAGVLGAFQ
jgi:hypothetical protein